MVAAMFDKYGSTKLTHSYSPGNVKLFVGAMPVSSWDSLTVTPSKPVHKILRGTNGEHIGIRNLGRLYTIELVLPQTSAGNFTIKMQHYLSQANFGTDGIMPVFIVDMWGGSVHLMTHARMLTEPTHKYTKTVSAKKWSFVGTLDANVFSANDATITLMNKITITSGG